MKSPKFRLRQNELSSIFTAGNVKITWKKIVRDALKNQQLRDPVEFLDFNIGIAAIAEKIVLRVTSGNYVPIPPKRILLEKSKGLCRQVVVPHPYDCLVMQCLSYNLHLNLRSHAPPHTHKNAFFQPERGFNSRKRNEYGGVQAWLNFKKEILSFAKTRRYLVVTDIANYHDFVSYTHLRNILANYLPEQKEAALDLMLNVLEGMLWQPDYMPRSDIGMPQIHLDAPRLLAHTFLYELDAFLAGVVNADYARYMDDIDVGVDDLETAKKILRDIDLTLQTRQVRLNSGKTKILKDSEINEHFKVSENLLLDNLLRRIERSPTQMGRHRKILLGILARWSRCESI
jgi:hypothetical protein